MCTKSQLETIKSEIYRAAVRIFGDRLDAVVLYGSYARGDYDDESDIDIIIRVKLEKNELSKYKPVFSEITAELGLDNDILVSTILISSDHFNDYVKFLPFYINVQREGIKIDA